MYNRFHPFLLLCKPTDNQYAGLWRESGVYDKIQDDSSDMLHTYQTLSGIPDKETTAIDSYIITTDCSDGYLKTSANQYIWYMMQRKTRMILIHQII